MVVNSKAELCNLALDLLIQSNEETITNIDTPNTNTEVVCSRWYDVTRKATLRKGIWNFALKRIILTPDATPPAFGYSQAYNLPADFIRIVSIGLSETTRIEQPFEIENGQILVNTESTDSLYLRYVFDQMNVAKFDACFLDVMSMELALRMAYKFSASSTRVQQLEEMLQDKLIGAKSVDGQERPPDRVDNNYLDAFRRSGAETDITFYRTS